MDVLYLDFQKAFDKVPHQRLLSKLEALGITGKFSGWIASWLNGRQQRVVLNGHKSSWIHVLSGVPQGSVLGPLLFIIFVNDLDDGVISKLLKFADDVKLIGQVASERDVDSLRADLQLLVEWSADWQMLFNVEKCKVLHVGYNNMCASYFIGNTEIQSTDEERDLGVIVHKSLKVSSQCNKVVKEAYSILGVINRCFLNKTKDILVPLDSGPRVRGAASPRGR